jgi:hypothetical protein
MATGQHHEAPDALVEAVAGFAHEAIAPEMRAAGMFAPPADAPASASPIEKLVAFTGRSVTRSSQ